MANHWFVFTTRMPESIFNPTSVFLTESNDSFPGEFSFMDSFETQGLYMHSFSLVKSDKYSLSEFSLSSAPLFSSFEVLFMSSK